MSAVATTRVQHKGPATLNDEVMTHPSQPLLVLQQQRQQQHEEYTTRLRAAVGAEVLNDPLGGISTARSLPPPRHCCSRERRPSIAQAADPELVWFGQLTCIECVACAATRSGDSLRESYPAVAQIAVLLLGHRRRLVTESVMRHVVGASAQAGHAPTVFAVLENMTMQRPTLFGLGTPLAHPHFRALSDEALVRRLRDEVRAAGGRVGSILVDRPPASSLPRSNSSFAAWRLFHYSERTRRTVAVALKKELIGYQLVRAYERRHRVQFDWWLLLREDAHFFAPLNLSAFAPGAVHGKGCARYGGWNDHVFLIWHTYAEAMLSSYRDLHTPQHADGSVCRLRGTGAWGVELSGKLTRGPQWAKTRSGGAAVRMDLLASATSEQWRERVGR